MNWIKVSEKMPESEKRVLLTDLKNTWIGYFHWFERDHKKKALWFMSHTTLHIVPDPTHWCEIILPEEI